MWLFLLVVIPGPAEGRNPESTYIHPRLYLDSGFAAARRPRMTGRFYARFFGFLDPIAETFNSWYIRFAHYCWSSGRAENQAKCEVIAAKDRLDEKSSADEAG